MERMISESVGMTALCLWEAWLEMERDDGGHTNSELVDKMERLREAVGTFSLRQLMIDLAPDCDAAWEAADAMDEQDSFDFDFCPTFLRGAIESGHLERVLQSQYAPRQTGTPVS